MTSDIKKPTFIVILPTKNNEKTIKRAILSVLKQDYDSYFELVVVTNGIMQDKTREVVNEVADGFVNRAVVSERKFVTVIDIPEDVGLVAAINIGIEKAYHSKMDKHNTWICRMDGDDSWALNKLSKQAEFIMQNSDVDVLGSQMLIVDQERNVLGATNYPLIDSEIKEWIKRGANPIGHPTVAFRWEMMDTVGRYENIFPYAEDFWLWSKAAILGKKFANLKEVLIEYTQETGKGHQNPLVGQSVAVVYDFMTNLPYRNSIK